MRSFVALSVVLLATSVAATSAITAKLTKTRDRLYTLDEGHKADTARAAHLKSRTPGGPTTVPATSKAFHSYSVSVGVGTPPTYYDLVIDTASSNTVCGINTSYVRTPTSIPTGEDMTVYYGTVAGISGMEYLDKVTLAPNLTIANQSIGDVLSSYGSLTGVKGILGLGPVGLTQGTLSPDTNATVPTIMNNLASQGAIQNQVLGVYLAPPASDSDASSALTFGGVDPSLYEGDISYAPLTKTYPAAKYWGINVTSCTYGEHTIISTSTAGIIDTTIYVLFLADDFFNIYLDAIPGAVYDNFTGFAQIPSDSVKTMQSLNFTIAGEALVLDTAAQLIPTDENSAWGLSPDIQYAAVSRIGSNSGEGLDFVFGTKVLERYYTVLDTENSRVGFAATKNTFTAYQA